MNNRYNIDTANDDLIQIDLKGGDWKVSNDREVVFFSIIRFSETPENPERLTIPVCKSDLKVLRDKLSQIID